jgi:imidazolonepropionase-like amidohydrolase
VRADTSPAEALRIPTWNGARFTGRLAELGLVEPHKRADLILDFVLATSGGIIGG